MSGFTLKSTKPENLSPFASQVFDTLAKYTAFPWPIMLAQCRRADLDPLRLDRTNLKKVIDYMADAVGRFTSPEKAAAVRSDLEALTRQR